MSQEDTKHPSKKLTLWQLMGSMLSGLIGIQSKERYERDFQQASIIPFFVAGTIFTLVFVGGIIFAVNYFV